MNINCDKLIKTYNTNCLNILDTSVKDTYYTISKYCMNGNKGRVNLMKLIYNHFTSIKPIPSFINGPVYLTLHWSDKYNMIIYTFGEYHDKNDDCNVFTDFNDKDIKQSIDEFLKDIILTTDVFIDLFIELPHTGLDYKKEFFNNNSIDNISYKFKNCLELSTRNSEECRLSRIHYIDVRDYYDSNNIDDISWIILQFNKIMTKTSQKRLYFNNLIRDTRISYIINKISNSTQEEYDKFWEKQIYSNPLLKKELEKSFFSTEIKDYFIKIYIEEANKYRSILIDYFRIILDNTKVKEFKKTFEYMWFTLANMSSFIPDIYTLSRIFKNFNLNSNIDQPERPHNIIIYTGDAHSKHYRDFFNFIGFKELAKTGTGFDPDNMLNEHMDGPSFCLNMKNFPQPFFTNIPFN